MNTVNVEARFADDSLIVDIDDIPQHVVYRSSAMLPLTALAAHPELMELFEFMLTLYAADRLVRRPERRWQRSFQITFPVRRLEAWAAAREAVEDLIWRCTGDLVRVRPVARPNEWMHCDSRPLHFELHHPRSTSIFLLSDGLDSLCGACSAVSEPGDNAAFLSVVTNSRRVSRIGKIREALCRRFEEKASFHRVSLNLVQAPQEQERTQRSRTMLAVTAGLTVAAAYDSKRLVVSENGIGILNLPLTALQSRHESSQVLHPGNLERWQEVSSALVSGAGLDFPNRFRTKAQMLRRLPDWAVPLIHLTSSCDAPQRMDQSADCGVCNSCAYRRLSLSVAGLSASDRRYTAYPPRGGNFEPASLFEYQASLLKGALNGNDVWRALGQAQPTLQESLNGIERERDHLIASTLELLRTHVREVQMMRWLAHAV